MPTLDCRTHREDGVTLVACRLSNDRAVPCRVRLDPAVDRIAPPRTGGYPAPGWTDGHYETVVKASTTVGVGFATPDSPSDPPATLTVLEADADPVDDGEPEPTATGAARSLLDPRPPRGAASVGRTRSVGDAEEDADPDRADGEVPPAVAAWLARVERRGDRAALRAVAERVTTVGRRIDAGES